jgi:hypothetical protein
MEEGCFFIEEHEMTDDLLRELMSIFNLRMWRKLIFLFLFLIVLSVINILLNKDYFMLFLSVFLILFMLLYMFYLPKRQIKNLRRRAMDLKGSDVGSVKLCFGERITGFSDNDVSHVDYDKITKIYDNKHSLILMVGKYQGVIVSKSGFVKGSLEEFKPFIMNRCPQIKQIVSPSIFN